MIRFILLTLVTTILTSNLLAAPQCIIKKQSNRNAWFVEQNGQNISGSNYTSMRSAIQRLNALRQQNICPARIAGNIVCKVEKVENRSYWYVSLNNEPISHNLNTLNAATSLLQNIINDGVCHSDVKSYCELRKVSGSNSWSIYQNGRQLTNNLTNLNNAIDMLARFKQERTCPNYSPQICKISKNANRSSWNITLGGQDILGSSYTSINSAISTFQNFVAKNVCADTNLNSACIIKKIENRNVWYVEQDSQTISDNFPTISSAQNFLKRLKTANACNENLQPGCTVEKHPDRNIWFISQHGTQLSSNGFSSTQAAASALNNMIADGICKKGVCEFYQDRMGISILRNGFEMGHNDNFDQAMQTMEDFLNENTCELPKLAHPCHIYSRRGRFFLRNQDSKIASSNNRDELLAMRNRLQNLGYCQLLDPNDVFISERTSGDHDGLRDEEDSQVEENNGHPIQGSGETQGIHQ